MNKKIRRKIAKKKKKRNFLPKNNEYSFLKLKYA